MKNVSDFTAHIFFVRKELFSWIYLLKKTPRRTKTLISPVWNKILKIWETLFELIQIEVHCSKNYFKISLLQEDGYVINIEKEPQKLRQKLKRIGIFLYVYIIAENICSASNPVDMVDFCKNALIL